MSSSRYSYVQIRLVPLGAQMTNCRRIFGSDRKIGECFSDSTGLRPEERAKGLSPSLTSGGQPNLYLKSSFSEVSCFNLTSVHFNRATRDCQPQTDPARGAIAGLRDAIERL